MTRKHSESGVTLMELLIAITLLAILSAGIVVALRVGLSAMDKAQAKLIANRRAAGITRILEQEMAGILPVTAECLPAAEGPGTKIAFFQGEEQTMRLASTYSLQQASRGMPMILEFQVIPGENAQGVRLVVNERLYTGPRGAGAFCAGMSRDPLTGAPIPQFLPVEIGSASFVLADKLAYCRFSYRELLPPPEMDRWVLRWVKPLLPSAIRIEIAPLVPDPARVQPVTLTIPIRVTRLPLEEYGN